MKFFTYFYNDEIEQFFLKKPQYFDKYTNQKVLAYGLGATLYMPATRPNIHNEILLKKHEGLTSLVIDLEDAVGDCDVSVAETLVIKELLKLYEEFNKGFLNVGDFPLLFIRVRTLEQLKRIKEQLGDALQTLTGVVLPKFKIESGEELLKEVQRIHSQHHPFYAMPILETAEVIHKETRIEELLKIKNLLNRFKDIILNIRIGATDFSGLYGIRRSTDTTVYEISVVRDCISDIVNMFRRADSSYVISGPVWEYFSSKERRLKPQVKQPPFGERFDVDRLKWRADSLGQSMDGLIREVHLDIENGLTGKTIIHPSHIKAVQALNVVSYEEYIDARNIIQSSIDEAGVIKSEFANKMNEMKPHYQWAQNIVLKSELYGVLNEEFTTIDLIKREVYV
ncbi:HpcH/HpaI aldolase/citrate lyase family protein [Neobacillus massiliamazoniensis]|uniref:ATP/GTP-binding protein n=1 Tax=Neobacillus massiliamazoniensis TaxID=1499688 RepID=A0A0U1P0L2_9BACI|nr:HpcH/HpaI aldolase/citrate lyase family protein [Neobacillus massiliamazoniensis]CRK83839.1 ATP/GTP-binding protein [Neobacillus massiliamazoniensis]